MIICPHDMIPMMKNTWRSLEVWRCPACFRGWYPGQSLRKITGTKRDVFRHLDVFRDPSKLIYRRTKRNCPIADHLLYRVIERTSALAVEMCHDVHGVLVEENMFRIIGESVPVALTAEVGQEYKGEGMYDPKHHAHIAVGYVLAQRLLKHIPHMVGELARLPT